MEKRKELKQLTRTKIIEVAFELFLKNGFNNTSTDDVAKLAGVSKGTVFNHFKKKEDLGFAVINHGLALLQDVKLGVDSLDTLASIIASPSMTSSNQTLLFLEILSSINMKKELSVEKRKELLELYIYPVVSDFELFFRPFVSSNVRGTIRVLLAIMDGLAIQYSLEEGLIDPRLPEEITSVLKKIFDCLLSQNGKLEGE
ncbi:MAG: TetR/AcrR family transcriptional regulator [Candidatus Odinarchaeota archaeon]